MNEYRLSTIKDGERYKTELTYNGRKVDFAPSAQVDVFIETRRIDNIGTLERNKNIDMIEVIISGENLK